MYDLNLPCNMSKQLIEMFPVNTLKACARMFFLKKQQQQHNSENKYCAIKKYCILCCTLYHSVSRVLLTTWSSYAREKVAD